MNTVIKNFAITERRVLEREAAKGQTDKADIPAEKFHQEEHHIAQEKYDPKFTVSIDFNSHQFLSQMQLAHPGQIGAIPSQNEIDAHAVLGMGDLFVMCGVRMNEIGHRLLEQEKARVPTNKRFFAKQKKSKKANPSKNSSRRVIK